MTVGEPLLTRPTLRISNRALPLRKFISEISRSLVYDPGPP
jgi:hypothetical protein